MKHINFPVVWDINGPSNLGQTPSDSQKKKKSEENLLNTELYRSWRSQDKTEKKSEKRDKYLDHARELKKLWNMKVTVIPIKIDALSTVTKGLVQKVGDLEIRGRVEITQTTALLRSARVLRRVLDTGGDLVSFKLQWKIIS